MQVNVAGIRRNIKNLAHNYSEAQIKVREATSNDPWGPSATIMAEIADLTYNVVAFSEIMQMIWKRLNDHGKYWRHVYKALILLEYLIKTGTEKVAIQCKENIFAIQTLRDFVYFEESKDQGTHVREKAKQLVLLLKDDERLKNERTKALKAKERFAQHASAFGSDGYIDGPTQRENQPPGWQDEPPKPASDLEFVRPQTAGEEELQLQLAMAMSREEAEQEEAKRRSDDVRLQLALSQSEQDFNDPTADRRPDRKPEEPKQSHLMDLLDISLGATSISSPQTEIGAAGGSDPWGTPARAASQLSDPWSGASSPHIDLWPSNAKPVAGSGLSSDAWIPAARTQSPSVASGSSNEGWLHNNPAGIINGNNAIGDPWLSKTTTSTPDPWQIGNPKPVEKPLSYDPWRAKQTSDPWALNTNNTSNKPEISPDLDDFDAITNRNKTGQETNSTTNGSNNNNASLLDELDPLAVKKPLKTPHTFLGENSSLVNLDNLIKPVLSNNTVGGAAAYNPFSSTTSIQPKTNLFQQQQPAVPSINQLKQQQPFQVSLNQDPWAPVSSMNNSSTQYQEYLIDYDSDQITVFTNNNNVNNNNNNNELNNYNNYVSFNNNNNNNFSNNYNNNQNNNHNDIRNVNNIYEQYLNTKLRNSIQMANCYVYDNGTSNQNLLLYNNSSPYIYDTSADCYENNTNNNNNMPWGKPEIVTSSNPFLS